MFSHIEEAWNKDPVKQITGKLSKGAFLTNTNYSEIFNFKDHNNSNKHVDKTPNSKDILSISDANSLSLLSENTNASNIINSDFSSFAPVNFDKYLNKKKVEKKHGIKNNRIDYSDYDSDIDIISDYLHESRCNYSIKHLRKCDRCYNKLKKLINTKVNNKFDELMLDNKMKQLQNMANIQSNMNQTLSQTIPNPQNNNHNNDSWKEVLIIVIGAIIAIFIIFLIVKAIYK